VSDGKTRGEQERELRELYRRVFSGPFGQKVLTHMLVELGHFNTVGGTEKEVALQNYAKLLLHRLGVWNADQAENIVSGLFGLPMK
jgi:hypothetical protein